MKQLTHKPNAIDRRKFLRTSMAVPSLFLVAPLTSGANQKSTKNHTSPLSIDEIEESIKVHFGSMFQLNSVHQDNDKKVTARIEHLENQYVVISDDLSNWKIIDSTDI